MSIISFPATKSGAFSSKLISEYNLINLVNRLTDKDSFIISSDTSNNVIKFSIHGYYFEYNYDSSLGNSLYAYIKISNSNEWSTLYLDGSLTDDDGNETGLFFTDPGSDSNYTVYPLQLTDDSGNIMEDNMLKFTTDSSTRSVSIDDGDLDK